jgi:hypothetical protein
MYYFLTTQSVAEAYLMRRRRGLLRPAMLFEVGIESFREICGVFGKS